MKRLCAALALAALVAAAAGALEVKEGRMRLVVDERTGRFAVYYLADIAKNVYVPLLYDQETRTTYPTLYLDQKTYKLGESTEFRTTVSARGASGIRVEYRSAFCVVRQDFSFIASLGSALADGLRITIEMENVSEKDLSMGLRYLLDTWLGEKSGTHFSVPGKGPVAAETSLSGGSMDASVVSPGDSGTSLQILLGGAATKPDRVLLANWKRLNDTAWSFEANASRAYTLLPYSINDSAAAIFFDPVVVRRGATLTVSIAMGKETSAGFPSTASAQTGDTRTATATALASTPTASTPLDIMTDYIAVRDLLKAINAMMAADQAPSEEELAAFESVLKRLEERKKGY